MRHLRSKPAFVLAAATLLVTAVSACGGSSPAAPDLDRTRERTVAAGTANFALRIDATIGGASVQTNETGAVSFTKREAHLYKLVPGQGVPQELILIGPFTYTNANVAAALGDPNVRPWTKLDTRRLRASEAGRADELAHVRALAYLAEGAGQASEAGDEEIDSVDVTHYEAEVDPDRLAARVPKSIRPAVANDYPAEPFPADFWLDDEGRLRRVVVAYRTAAGTQIRLEGAFTAFGDGIDLTLPAADRIEDITP
jgi:hypothetical protein